MTISNLRCQTEAMRRDFLCTAHEWSSWIDVVKSAATTTLQNRKRSRNCLPTRITCCASNRNNSSNHKRFDTQNGIVILSEAKGRRCSSPTFKRKSEMFRCAQHDMP